MRVGVIGLGRIGSALATLLARHGNELVLGSRNPDATADFAAKIGASRPVAYREVVARCELLCISVLWEHNAEVLESLGDLSGKVLIDPSNPETPNGEKLALGHSISGAELIAERVPSARVVKAFNYVYAQLLHEPSIMAQLAPSIFLCGDDADAKRLVSDLVRSCALEPIDCGPLRSARYLEPLAFLMVQLVRDEGWPAEKVAMKLAHV